MINGRSIRNIGIGLGLAGVAYSQIFFMAYSSGIGGRGSRIPENVARVNQINTELERADIDIEKVVRDEEYRSYFSGLINERENIMSLPSYRQEKDETSKKRDFHFLISICLCIPGLGGILYGMYGGVKEEPKEKTEEALV